MCNEGLRGDFMPKAIDIKATIVYWFSKVLNQLRENTSGLQTKIEVTHQL